MRDASHQNRLTGLSSLAGGDGDDDDATQNGEMTTHGDKSPDPGQESYTDPRIGEGESTDEQDIL